MTENEDLLPANDRAHSRRQFLFSISKVGLSFLAANTVIYTVGTAFKNLDGSMTAGAKTWSYYPGVGDTVCDVGGQSPAYPTLPDCDAARSDYILNHPLTTSDACASGYTQPCGVN